MSKNKKKYYVVARGRCPGIYDTWFGENGAKVQIDSFPGAVYKGFVSRADAENWLAEKSGRPATLHSKVSPEKIDQDMVVIYTDGGCLKNPGPGGYGAVILEGESRKELSGGYRHTTNNRMELMACIVALRSFEEQTKVRLFSDSRYVVNGISKGWAAKWKKNNWMRNNREAAENADLWSDLLELTELHDVEFVWVKGHAGTPENERCDELAGSNSSRQDLPVDKAFEEGRTRFHSETLF